MIFRAVSLVYEALKGFLGFVVYIGLFLGQLYWWWLSIQLGSFWMFAAGAFPLFMPFTPFIGMYSFIFGLPSWLLALFG